MASLRKRGKVYYASFYVGGREERKSLDTTSYRIAKERLRNFESALAHGTLDDALPTRTPIADIVADYLVHIRNTKTKNGVRVDTWYFRSIFGPICPFLEPVRSVPQDRKRTVLRAKFIEDIRTQDIAAFITRKTLEDGIGPKTANRYREIIMRLFSWAMAQRGVRVPGGQNPAKAVERYRQRAPKIEFLSLNQVEEQLEALSGDRPLQTITALYIYAGLRREEALWLTKHDVSLPREGQGVIRVCAKTVLGEYWEPKTKTNRAVPVSRTLRRYLDQYNSLRTEGRWYFPSPRGMRWNPDNFSERLRRANKALGFSWNCLQYRHTFGSQLAMKGESLYKISTLMGNSPEVCRRHYAALLPESMIDSVEFDERPEDTSTPPPRGLRLIADNGQLLEDKDVTG